MRIRAEISGARSTGMRDNDGQRLREIFLIVTEDESRQLHFGQHVTLEAFTSQDTEAAIDKMLHT